jgi:hypothetical protein
MSTKIIKINRGDSYEFDVKITKKNSLEPYMLKPGKDVVYFAILFPHQPFEAADPERQIKGYDSLDQNQCFDLITGKPTEDTGIIRIKIEPKDTRFLSPGVYYYTVKLQRGGTIGVIDDLDDNPDEVRTIIERTKFIVNE